MTQTTQQGQTPGSLTVVPRAGAWIETKATEGRG